jgi:hypothetical protein
MAVYEYAANKVARTVQIIIMHNGPMEHLYLALENFSHLPPILEGIVWRLPRMNVWRRE